MNLNDLKDCLEKAQREPTDYVKTYQSSIFLWEEQAAEAIANGNKPWLSDARCHIQRLKELEQALELRNKAPGQMTDEEIANQRELLEDRDRILRAEQDERFARRKAQAELPLWQAVEDRKTELRLIKIRQAEEADRLEAALAIQAATPPPTLEELVQEARTKTSYGFPGQA